MKCFLTSLRGILKSQIFFLIFSRLIRDLTPWLSQPSHGWINPQTGFNKYDIYITQNDYLTLLKKKVFHN